MSNTRTAKVTQTGMRVLVGTDKRLYEVGTKTQIHLDRRSIKALTQEGRVWWAIVDSRAVWRWGEEGMWEEIAHTDDHLTCLLPTPAGLLVGTAGAHLLRLETNDLVTVEPFGEAPGRQDWHTPWGGPPDTRSIAADPSGTIYVNVHVGGILRSTDRGRSWQPTVPIESDVHEVFTDPARPGFVFAAAAVGLGISSDYGESWTFETDGLHAKYARAVAVADDIVLVTASTGPGGKHSAVYRRRLGKAEPFERCRQGLPEWFSNNIDTGCLATSGAAVAIGTADGSVFLSPDHGETWDRIAEGLPPVRCIAIG